MFPNIIFLFLMQIYNYYCSYTTISIVNFKKNYNSFLFLSNYLYLYKKKIADPSVRSAILISLYNIYSEFRLDKFEVTLNGLNLLVEFSQHLVELLNRWQRLLNTKVELNLRLSTRWTNRNDATISCNPLQYIA